MPAKKEKIKKNGPFYLDIPYVYKDQMQEMFAIKWDMNKRQWFTTREWEVQDIEEKIEKLRDYARNSFENRFEAIQKYVDFILYIFPPNTSKRQEMVKELYANPDECLRVLRRESLLEEEKKHYQKPKEVLKKKAHLKIVS